jgi:NTE family protein
MSRRNSRHKGVNIALQGGGAHGAFTWGVLDRLFEDDRLWIEAISGTSAGAMNAVVAAQGMFEGGAAGARARLASFWRAVSKAARTSPLRRSPLAALTGDWSLKSSPAYVAFDIAARLASPYDVNPLGLNPLRDVVSAEIDFAKVRACRDMGVFVGATNAETGLGRAFAREEITLDTVMASACLPYLFRAVEIDGAPYWDGGYSGNPPLMPFLESSPSDDVMIVQINPIRRDGAPRRAQDIQNRINEISFNSALLHELRTIHLVNGMIDRGEVAPGRRRRVFVHVLTARKQMRALDASSKLNAEWAFLEWLFRVGRETAGRWLDCAFDDLGRRSTVDLDQMLGVSALAAPEAARAAQ